MVSEGWVFDACDEARDLEELVDFAEVCIGEGETREAAEGAAGAECTGGKNVIGDFAGWTVVGEEDDTFLREEAVHEDDDWVGIRAVGGEMGVEGEGLGILNMRRGKGGDELDQRELEDVRESELRRK